MQTTEVLNLLRENETKDLLRFVTAGSVDDGKSTLIGHLLVETKGIYQDQLEAVRRVSGKGGSTDGELDLALVTDGLKAEREQGITIDVAYRYFSTPKRKFIIADTPGHEQYTRNMATGASTASLVIILIDARSGVVTQSKRHAFIASLLGIPHMVVAVNKMDLVDYSQEVYEKITTDFRDFAAKLEAKDIAFIPVSALKGDNVVHPSERMPWYRGGTLLNHLETVHIASDRNLIDLRFPVQYVLRPDQDFRGYLGTLASGSVKPGDEVMVIPSGVRAKVATVFDPEGKSIDEAFPPMAAGVTLDREVDVSRGDMLVHVHNVPRLERTIDAMVVWMASEPMVPGKSYVIKHTTRSLTGVCSELRYRTDVNTLHRTQASQLGLNEIGRCLWTLSRPIAYDPYSRNRSTGAFIIVDRVTNNTVGAGMILDREPNERMVTPGARVEEPASAHVHRMAGRIEPAERAKRLGHEPATLWLTGLTGAGKSTLAYELERRLFDLGCGVFVLDGENMRLGVSKDLGFSADGRAENVRRAAEVARMFNGAGLICICSFVSPMAEDRERAREVVGADRFLEVYLSAPVDACRARKPEVYRLAETGEIRLFSGVTAPYEAPQRPELALPTHEIDLDECVDRVLATLRGRGVLHADVG